ncbi:MAG: hypothetical protein NZ526_02590 [Aquificaceae bacterium]|nr:hypothetical protein [Aquificaceae bacterium]
MITEKLLTYGDTSPLPKEGRCEVTAGMHYLITSKLRDRRCILSEELGLVIDKELLTLRVSNTAFYSKEVLKEIPRGFIQEPPDLVVAEEASTGYFEEKLKDYIDFGVGGVVFVDHKKKMVLAGNEERRVSSFDLTNPAEAYHEVYINFGEVLEGL